MLFRSLHDQIFAEKRIERLSAMTKKIKDEDQQKELALMNRLKDFLESEKPLRLMDITEDEEKIIRSYPFITRKKMVIALNVSEGELDGGELDGGEPANEDVPASFQKFGDVGVMAVSAKVEAEIALLDTKEEKDEFLKALGIKETALENLTRLCLQSLNLISFFTVGKDEVRQWLIKKGSTAPKAAGTIHSDIERGFIRAEVFKYDELMEKKTEAELKKSGRIYVEGRDYFVVDGDILNIRFAV